jgi:hypothetical protein
MHSGIDLHKNDLVITTLNSAGVAVQQRRRRTRRPAVAPAYFVPTRAAPWRN